MLNQAKSTAADGIVNKQIPRPAIQAIFSQCKDTSSQFTKVSRVRLLHFIGQSILKVNLVYLVNCTMASQRPTFRIFSFFSTSLG